MVLHLPMHWMVRHCGFVLVDMPMDAGMPWGMALIVGGIALTGYGLLPEKVARSGRSRGQSRAATGLFDRGFARRHLLAVSLHHRTISIAHTRG